MSYIDIGIIAFLVLFAALGVWKGVQKSALALGAFVISFVIAFFLANVVAEAFLGIDSVKEFVMGKDGWSLYNWISSSMGGSPWEGKSFMAEHFFKPIYDVVITSKELSASFTAHDGVALCMAFGIFSAMIGVCLFIVIRALMCIVTMIVKSYIPQKKSVGNRVAGVFVGMARGAVWSFIITIVFSALAGLTFLPAMDVINDNYENSVMAHYLNEGAYGIKNGVFIPDEDMFSRLVIKGGFNVHKSEEGEDPPPPATNELEIKKNVLYSSFMNLNYASGSRYTTDLKTGVVTDSGDNENNIALNASDYNVTEFDQAVAAIIDYNNKIGASIKREAGTLSTTDMATLDAYDETYKVISRTIYGENGLVPALGNYKRMLTDEEFGTHGEQGIVDVINEEIQEYYDAIVEALDKLKIEYAKFELFVNDSGVGELVIPEYPEVILDHLQGEESEPEEPGTEEEEEEEEGEPEAELALVA